MGREIDGEMCKGMDACGTNCGWLGNGKDRGMNTQLDKELRRGINEIIVDDLECGMKERWVD